VAPDRSTAAAKLIELGCTIILSDDGLQHYRLGRAIEIVVIDGSRSFGNKQLLPVGPLRESVSRLKSVDMIVINNQQQTLTDINHQKQFSMKIQPLFWRNLVTEEIVHTDNFITSGKLNAVAGIGNPQRFFKTLQDMKIEFSSYSFDDHHQFSPADFEMFGDDIVAMTEKDAVKCKSFAKANWYSLVVGAHLPEDFWQNFESKIKSIRQIPGSIT
jgi:tetraacyldisaccharide 4'-kinase